MPKALGEFLAAAPRGAEALVTPSRRLTYGGLHDAALRVARALQARGLETGDRVAIALESGEHWLALFYGAALLGVVAVPLRPNAGAVTLDACARRTGCRVIFRTHGDGAAHRIVPGEESWRAFAAGDRGQPLRAAGSPQDLLLIQFPPEAAADSTGVMLSHDSVLRNAWTAGARIGLGARDRYFSAWPFWRLEGSVLSALMALVHGACLVTLPSFEAGAALELLDKERCTLVTGEAAALEALAAHPDARRRKRHLQGGWADAGPATMRRIIDALGAKQVCSICVVPEAAASIATSDWRDPEALRVQGLATPYEGLHVRTVDGEIQVRGWSAMRGYWDDAAETSRAFTPEGFLRTGLRGELHAGGRLRAAGAA